jgi:hypothetical protein
MIVDIRIMFFWCCKGLSGIVRIAPTYQALVRKTFKGFSMLSTSFAFAMCQSLLSFCQGHRIEESAVASTYSFLHSYLLKTAPPLVYNHSRSPSNSSESSLATSSSAHGSKALVSTHGRNVEQRGTHVCISFVSVLLLAHRGLLDQAEH